MPLNPGLKDALETINASLRIPERPWFVALNAGQVPKGAFLKSQVEFAHLVRFFNRPMAQVIANIPDSKRRMAIVGNLWEEHGNGLAEDVHEKTIMTLIHRLSGTIPTLSDATYSTNIKTFNHALRSIAAFEDYRFSSAVFAGIERSFVDISTQIYEAIVSNRWLQPEQITHYRLHREIDIRHAEEFLEVASDQWNMVEQRAKILAGLELGGQMFLRVYDGFYLEFKGHMSDHPGAELAVA